MIVVGINRLNKVGFFVDKILYHSIGLYLTVRILSTSCSLRQFMKLLNIRMVFSISNFLARRKRKR